MKLTRPALELLHYSGTDADTILSAARDALKRPTESAWYDDELYVTHTLMFATPSWNLTTDYIIEESNYRAALALLTAEYPRAVEDASFGHWTYSSYSCIKVRVLNSRGNVTAAFTAAMLLVIGTQDYPLIDDSLYSELEQEVWEGTLTMALDDYSRDLERADLEPLTETHRADISEYLTEHYGPGYSGADYVSQDHFNEARHAAGAPAIPADA